MFSEVVSDLGASDEDVESPSDFTVSEVVSDLGASEDDVELPSDLVFSEIVSDLGASEDEVELPSENASDEDVELPSDFTSSEWVSDLGASEVERDCEGVSDGTRGVSTTGRFLPPPSPRPPERTAVVLYGTIVFGMLSKM